MPSLWTLVFQLVIVNAFLYCLLGMTVGTSFHCAVRREISPCTCKHQEENMNGIQVTCESMSSFSQVVDALQDKFEPETKIALTISFSQLEDLSLSTFLNLSLNVQILKLNYDNLSTLSEHTFNGLERTEFLSLSFNPLHVVPQQVLQHMPILKTLDLRMCQLNNLTSMDFQGLPMLSSLLIPNNFLSSIEKDSIPDSVKRLQLRDNQLATLNGTLRGLTELEWLFIGNNRLTTIDGELPRQFPNTQLKLLDITHNYIEYLPTELRFFQALNIFSANNNKIKALNGTLARHRKLEIIDLDHNSLTELAEDDFADIGPLELLDLSFNQLTLLNSSLLHLKNLRLLNLSYNLLPEFSLQEIRGLRRLETVHLSHNKIANLSGRMENHVELETRLTELRLDYNELESLSGALMGLNKLQSLNISHNRLTHISTDDLIVLDDLTILDISYNKLTTLDELSKTVLPKLGELIATHNALTTLGHDFDGLPALCRAYLSHNNIQTIKVELAVNNTCQIYGVRRALNIYLNDNPLWCDDVMLNIIKEMNSSNNTKIHGTDNCTTELNNTLIASISSIP